MTQPIGTYAVDNIDGTEIPGSPHLNIGAIFKRGFERVEPPFRKHPDGEIILPTRGTRSSAGYDFYSPVAFSLHPGERIKFATDVKAYMQSDEVLQVHIRSSLGIKGIMITNTVGIVDSDYYSNPDNDGNIHIFLHNLGDDILDIEVGDRIAQGIFMKYLTVSDDDTVAERLGGYGHTGR